MESKLKTIFKFIRNERGFALLPIHWSASIISVAFVFYGMAVAEILGRKLYSEYALVTISERLLQIIFSIILYFEIGLIGILIGYFLGPILLSYRYLDNLKNITFKINSLKHRISFTLHSYGLNIIGSLSAYLDKIIIGSIFGFYALGLYQLGFQFLMLLAIILGSLYTYLLPEESSGVNRVEIKILGIISSIILALLTIVISPYIIKILFPNFINAIQLVQIMSIAIIPLTITSLTNARLFREEKSRYALVGGLIYIISMITGLAIFGICIGIIGLAIAIIVAQTSRAIYLWSKTGLYR